MWYVYSDSVTVEYGYEEDESLIPEGAQIFGTEAEMNTYATKLEADLEGEIDAVLDDEGEEQPVPVSVANPRDAETVETQEPDVIEVNPEMAPDGAADATEEEETMADDTGLINTEALGPVAAKVSKTSQYGLAIAVGLLAFIALFASVLYMFGQNVSGDGILSGIAGGVLMLAVWWTVRSDNRKAEAADDKTLITTNNTFDVAVTAVTFGGIVILALLLDANVAVLVAAGIATIVGYLSARWVWNGIS